MINNIKKQKINNYLWFAIASGVYSCTSAVLFWTTVRICGSTVGGIFSITFASSQLLQAIGYFGIRNYQVSDIQNDYAFSIYLTMRILLLIIMMIACIIYQITMNYSGEKSVVFTLLCIIKMFEALADVFEGMMQQKNHLDMAAKAWLMRSVIALIGFTSSIIIFKNLIIAVLIMLFGTILGTILFSILPSKKIEKIIINFNKDKICKLLIQCLPLFLSSILFLYINNASKIAIDLLLGYETQTIFNIIFMPAYLFNLLFGFLFRPLINNLTVTYYLHNKNKFKKTVFIFIKYFFLLMIFISISAIIFGIPILSWIFNISLVSYKLTFNCIIIGGCLNAGVSFFNIILTIMRKHNTILFAYGVTVILIFLIINPFVSNYGIIGAAYLYLLSMIILLLGLLIIYYIYGIRKKNL